MTKNDVNLEKVIKEEYEVEFSEYAKSRIAGQGKYNKCTSFLLPMIGFDLRNKYVTKYLSNLFVDDKGIEHDFLRPIFALFRIRNFKEKDWEELYKVIVSKKDLLVYDYFVGTDKDGYMLVMFVFQTSEAAKEDYYHFRAGRYSKFSEEYKAKFPKEVISNGKVVESIIWGAMNKSSTLKDTIAKEFSIKDSNGNVLNQLDYTQFRSFIDTLDEIWDSPKPEHELYRFKIKNYELKEI